MLKFHRDVTKHSRSCRSLALGSMVSAEAAKLRTRFSQNPYGKRLPNLYQNSGVIGSVERPVKNCRESCGSMFMTFRAVSNRSPVLENGQVESFHRGPTGSHKGAG